MSQVTSSPQLEGDSFFITDLPLSQLRLFNRQELLWLILEPRIANVTELYELNESQQHQLLEEINLISKVLKTHFSAQKLNIATLGNYVPQLHFHIVCRRHDDPFWPKPPFGLPTQTYEPDAAKAIIDKIKSLLA